MRLKIILFNLSIIIFLICLIYLYIYVNYKYEGFVAPTDPPPVKDSTGEVFRPEGERKDPITDKTTESNVLNESATIAKINPTLSELEKTGVSPETAIPARVLPYFNVGRINNNKPVLPDGYYWVDFNDIGKKYTYCLMDKNYFGGGWMLAMRAVRGSRTFGYNSEHWTNATTLNDTIEKIRDVGYDADLNVSSIGNAILNNYEGNTAAINRYDAKFDIFNQYKANEWMAIFYFKNHNGVVLKGGDPISGGNQGAKGWIWRETNLMEADRIERSPLQLFQRRSNFGRYGSLIDLRGNYGVSNAKNLDKFRPVNGMPQLWSSQYGYNFYGIDYDVPEWYENWGSRGASTRWGLAWNENWYYPTNNYTNDVYGGIGLRFPGAGQPGYSAGDFIYCCHDSVGANSSIAFEWYVR